MDSRHPVQIVLLGPQIPDNIFVYNAAPVTLNSTHVAIIGVNADFSDDVSYEGLDYVFGLTSIEDHYKTIVYDFETRKWKFWARLPLSHMYTCYHRSPISAVIFFDKIGNRLVEIIPMQIFNKLMFCL